MTINNIDLPSDITKYLKYKKYELYTMQNQAITEGLLNNKNFVISIPTANGKTVYGILAMLNHISQKRRKIIYLVPFKALANEKYHEFIMLTREILKNDLKVIRYDGDSKISYEEAISGDVILMTNEMLYNVMAKDHTWIKKINLLIMDEFYLLNNYSRGPTFEIILTLFKELPNPLQIILLGPYMQKLNNLISWLGAKCIQDDIRLQTLTESICVNNNIETKNKVVTTVSPYSDTQYVNLSLGAIIKNKLTLLFVFKIEDTITYAQNIIKYVELYNQHLDKKKLNEIAENILIKNENTAEICILAKCIKNGVAFHHRGLNQYCRDIIEENIQQKYIKCTVCTETLQAGINFPINRVIIDTPYDLKRLSLLSYQQFCGRAGRPPNVGESIIICKHESDSKNIRQKYFPIKKIDEHQSIYSHLTIDDKWINYILYILAIKPNITDEKILNFFQKTLDGEYFKTYNLYDKLHEQIKFLIKLEMIKEDDGYIITEFGRLFLSFHDNRKLEEFYRAYKILKNSTYNQTHVLGLLCLLTKLINQPIVNTNNYDDNIIQELKTKYDELWFEMDMINVDDLMILDKLISEDSWEDIVKSHPTIITTHYKLYKDINFFTQTLSGIALYIDRRDLYEEIQMLDKRIKYGIKPDLIDIVQIEEIGRGRGRALHTCNIKNLDDLNDATIDDLVKVPNMTLKLTKVLKNNLRKGICTPS